MKQYQVQKADAPEDIAANSPLWESTEPVSIDCFPWQGGYRPNTTVQLLYTDGGISLRYETDETPLKAVYKNNNESVWLDSCVEFFIKPNQNDDRYLNFEMNSIGTLLLGIGPKADGRDRIDFDVKTFRITSDVTPGKWVQRLYVPFSFLKEQVGAVSDTFRGNLFKCGDETEHPHFGCWSEITAPKPQFHLPEFFGEFTLQK